MKHTLADDVIYQFQILQLNQIKNFNLQKKIVYYLDEDIITGRSRLKDEQWSDTSMCSDVGIEKLSALQTPVRTRSNKKMKDEEARLMWSDGISRPIPRSERSIQVKTARKKHTAHRQKKYLDEQYEVLAPRSSVGKISPTSVIRKPNRPEVRVRKSDNAKFGTRNEQHTELSQYIDRGPEKNQEKTLKQRIINHKKDLLRKD